MLSISIIIPIYNVEKYIERCILSVMGQKGIHGFIECILVDDCTPDGSMQIAQQLIGNYQGPIHFQILHNKENLGLSCSRNNGLKIAKGDFVYFLDSDDYIFPNCLNLLSQRLTCNEGYVDMVIGNSYDFQHNKYWQNLEGEALLLTDHDTIMRLFLQFEIPMMAWNKLVRRQFLLDNHLLFIPRMIHEDELWSYELYNVVNSVVLIPEITYSYEDNAGSITSSPINYVRRVEAYHKLVNVMLASLKCNNLYVERFFWGIHMYMRSIDLLLQHELPFEFNERNNALRQKMMKKSLGDGQWAISFFLFLTVFPPFVQLVRFGWFRNHYHVMRSFFRNIALKFDNSDGK